MPDGRRLAMLAEKPNGRQEVGMVGHVLPQIGRLRGP
jgi:hypothetical protein